MAYTDPTLNNTIKVKKVHLTELKSSIDTMITNKKVSVTSPTLTYTKVNSANIKALQTAINALETAFSGNCCQSNCCQTCQTSKCQSCQTSTCQSQSCQTSKCQSCQSCQSYSCSCSCTGGD